MADIKTKIGLEIHVQLNTLSKMFCRCNNQSFAEATDGKRSQSKAPNTVVCSICLGMPGTLPVANKQAILSTIKTGLALNCQIPKIAKFDRKHYFYPDLPKGYQISQYDLPFCSGGYLEVSHSVISSDNEKSHEILKQVQDDTKIKIRLNRIHLEEDAGKLIHPSRDRAETGSGGKSLVDLNRAGTPLMEIVTEPDITSPEQAGDFLRKLQKIVRDEVNVSEASMEKGHMRCDANISVSDENGRMSAIIELKNLNSFRFVEKALTIEEGKLKAEYPNWPEKLTKATHGYDSKKNETYVQRVKEEAADYRYFPEPDLPPFDSSQFDLEALKLEIGEGEESNIASLTELGISEADAKILMANKIKEKIFNKIAEQLNDNVLVAKTIVHNYFGFELVKKDIETAEEYAKLIDSLADGKIQKHQFAKMARAIHEGESFDKVFSDFSGGDEKINIDEIIEKIIKNNPAEVEAYKAGKKQILGFFMGQAMKESGGKIDPSEASRILRERLDK